MSKLLSMLMDSGGSNIIYAPKLDGTEEIRTMSGSVTPIISNNILSGGSGYLTKGWDNTVLWELSFQFRSTYKPNTCGFFILPPTMTTRDYTEFMFTADCHIYPYYNGQIYQGTNNYTHFYSLGNLTSWTEIVLRKQATNQLWLKISNITDTFVIPFLSEHNKMCIGVDSWAGTSEITNIVVTKTE